MKIEYVHFSEPDRIKIYDTEKALENNPFIQKNIDEWNEFELQKFEQDKRRGRILRYKALS